MRATKAVGTILATSLLAASPAAASGHLVTEPEARAAVARCPLERAADEARLQSLLMTPSAERAAARVGVRLEAVRAAVASLSDREVHDLAARAQALQGDPVAGQVDPWVNDVLVVVLIVGIVVLVLSAV